MSKQIEYWKNRSGKYTYRIRSPHNGKVIIPQNQGFSRMQGLRKNLSAAAYFFGNSLEFDSTGLSAHDLSGHIYQLVKVKPPKP